MLDNAGIKMAQGEKISCEQIDGVNDNMSEPHFHDFFELYYLESGERYQMVQNELIIMKPDLLQVSTEKFICIKRKTLLHNILF